MSTHRLVEGTQHNKPREGEIGAVLRNIEQACSFPGSLTGKKWAHSWKAGGQFVMQWTRFAQESDVLEPRATGYSS